jgi:hypothetical protein
MGRQITQIKIFKGFDTEGGFRGRFAPAMAPILATDLDLQFACLAELPTGEIELHLLHLLHLLDAVVYGDEVVP